MKVSLVMPVKNEEALIESFFNTLLTMDHIPEEVIVVDNNSNDATLDIVESWKQRLNEVGSQLAVLSCIHGHQAEARNMGFGTAKHPLIVSVDADTILSDDWISAAVEEFEKDPELVAASGPMLYKSKLLTVIHMILFYWYKVFPRGYYFYGSHAAFLKKAYHESGGMKNYRSVADHKKFSEPFDDIYLSVQLQSVGHVRPFSHLNARGVYRVEGEHVSVLRQLGRQMRQARDTIRFYRLAKKIRN